RRGSRRTRRRRARGHGAGRRPRRRESARSDRSDPRSARKAGGLIIYRDAVKDDAAAAAAFARATFVDTFGHLYPPEDLAAFLAEKYSTSVFRADIGDAETHFRLACEGDEIVGYCKIGGAFDLPVEREPRAVELHRLYVHPRVKGAGIAKALMDEAL